MSGLPNDFPTGDEIIASATRYLIEGGENDAASMLLACTLDSFYQTNGGWRDNEGEWVEPVALHLRSYRVVVDVLENDDHPITKQIYRAISRVLPYGYALSTFSIRAVLMTIDPTWRRELENMARGIVVHNQAPLAQKPIVWEHLKFQSPPEVSIAQALDRAGVMFLPLCRSRVNAPEGRVTREPDFLVCDGARWGVLEVDGATYHPASRTVHDHERDALFYGHGAFHVRHFDAQRCIQQPDDVVKEFLTQLRRKA